MSNGHLKPSADRQSLGLTQVPRQDTQWPKHTDPATFGGGKSRDWFTVRSTGDHCLNPILYGVKHLYMMCIITTLNYSNARGTSCHNPPWESLWIKQETLNQQMFLLVGWLCITATLPISKNGEEIWGINNSNCELTIQVNMEDVTQLTMEAIQLWLELLQPFTRLFPGLGTWERNAVEVPSMPTSKHQRLYLSYMVETSGSTIGL